MFNSRDEMMIDFSRWGSGFNGSVTGYQYGYPDDRKWFSIMTDAPNNIGHAIISEIPTAKFLFWVDFTADAVDFKNGGMSK